MTALLDTHSLIWAVLSPWNLTAKIRIVLTDSSNIILVSAASAWEIATKVRIGKLPECVDFERNFIDDVVRVAGYKLRPITVEDGLRAGRLVGKLQDPFDRMIAAQALADDIVLISRDAKMDEFGVRRIW